jgi:elongation factor 3
MASESAVREAFRKALVGAEIDDDMREYAEDAAWSTIEEGGKEEDLADALVPILADLLSDEGAGKVVAAVAKAACAAPAAATAAAAGGAKSAAPAEDILVCREHLMLMYGGGQQLLKDTTLKLVKRHRYGIVGANGAGKSTLMQALASGAIDGMPANFKVVHLRHEQLDDFSDRPAIDFVKNFAALAQVTSMLESVGFPREHMEKQVDELSGGWRMRLLLASGMLQNPDLLLLDEPQNHLDVHATTWLVDYINNLHSTSITIAHDASFLDRICTDIIHFDEAKLVYYPGNFSDFKGKRQLREEEAAELLLVPQAVDGARLQFPNPGKVEGVTSMTKPILEAKNCFFRWIDAN